MTVMVASRGVLFQGGVDQGNTEAGLCCWHCPWWLWRMSLWTQWQMRQWHILSLGGDCTAGWKFILRLFVSIICFWAQHVVPQLLRYTIEPIPSSSLFPLWAFPASLVLIPPLPTEAKRTQKGEGIENRGVATRARGGVSLDSQEVQSSGQMRAFAGRLQRCSVETLSVKQRKKIRHHTSKKVKV